MAVARCLLGAVHIGGRKPVLSLGQVSRSACFLYAMIVLMKTEL